MATVGQSRGVREERVTARELRAYKMRGADGLVLHPSLVPALLPTLDLSPFPILCDSPAVRATVADGITCRAAGAAAVHQR